MLGHSLFKPRNLRQRLINSLDDKDTTHCDNGVIHEVLNQIYKE